MSDTAPKSHDELAGTEQPFVQHLIELRDRLVKAVAAVAVVTLILAVYPGPGPLYDILAAPLVAHLPSGATMIATSVISPFMVPLKIMMMAAFLVALPVGSHRCDTGHRQAHTGGLSWKACIRMGSGRCVRPGRAKSADGCPQAVGNAGQPGG